MGLSNPVISFIFILPNLGHFEVDVVLSETYKHVLHFIFGSLLSNRKAEVRILQGSWANLIFIFYFLIEFDLWFFEFTIQPKLVIKMFVLQLEYLMLE